MKVLTKEQEQAHYNATLQGGILGGGLGLAFGGLGVFALSRRYQFVRQLTLPLKAFLVTSSATFATVVSADHASRAYEREQNPIDREFDERKRQQAAQETQGKTFTQRAMEFGRKERYKIVGASWIASMFIAFGLVNRNKYLTGQQKLVQARVYAQFLTVGVLVATAAFEISDSKNEEGRYETVKIIDPDDPEHKRIIEKKRPVEESDGDTLWKEMVAAEEERLKEREEDEKQIRAKEHKKHKKDSEHKKESGSKKKHDDEPKEDEKKKDGKKTDTKNDSKKSESDKDEGEDEKKSDQEKSKSKEKSQK